jgi:hypothetical protein
MLQWLEPLNGTVTFRLAALCGACRGEALNDGKAGFGKARDIFSVQLDDDV